MRTWIRSKSPGATKFRSPNLKLKLRREDVPRTLLMAEEEWTIVDYLAVSESQEGEIVDVDVVNESLASRHRAVWCTIKLQKCETWNTQLEVLKRLLGAGGGKGNGKDKDGGQNWDLK